MKFNESDAILSSDCYFCYSFNLHRFLKNEKNICHINCGINKKTKKTWFSYIRTDLLNEALSEWSNRKINKDFYVSREEVTSNEEN